MQRSITRRSFIKGIIAAGALAALGPAAVAGASPGSPPATPGSAPVGARLGKRAGVSAWVWRFDEDGEPESIRREAAARNMRVILKTHDGLSWMSRWDDSAHAVSGPEQLRRLRDYFAEANVPVDAWCVPAGTDPVAEAEMCSQVIDAGIENLYLDLEKPDGSNFWQGTNEDAVRFGAELRRLQPRASILVAPDARPWQIEHVPMMEFAQFCDAIAPQSYWKLFNTPTNHKYMEKYGYRPGPEGITPEFMLDATVDTFARFQRKVLPIGDGEASAPEWARFMHGAEVRGLESVSVWRFGTTKTDVWDSIVAPRQTSFAETLATARSVFRSWRQQPAAGLKLP